MNLKETIENITNQHISEGLQRTLRVSNAIEKTSAARPRPAGGFQHTDAEHGKLISNSQKLSARATSSRIQNKPGSETPAKPSAKPSLLGKIGSGIKKVVGLKEYYKEILNNLLMTEVTASPKGQPVEPGGLRADRLAGLAAEHGRLTKDLADGIHKNTDSRDGQRASRIADTLAAKGADTHGRLNVFGHGARTEYAERSNENRLGKTGKDNDRRSLATKIAMGNDRRYKSALENDD